MSINRFMRRTDELHGNAFPVNLVNMRPEDAFVRKHVIEFTHIPVAAPGLEVSVGIGADVYVTADYPVDIYYGDSDHANCPHVMDVRFIGLTKKIYIRNAGSMDYGRCVVYTAFPIMGARFIREDPLLMPLVCYEVVGVNQWLADEDAVNVVGGLSTICTPPVEAMYVREYCMERSLGIVRSCRFIEQESGGAGLIHSVIRDNPTDTLQVRFDNPLKISSRFIATIAGSTIPVDSTYTFSIKFHRI